MSTNSLLASLEQTILVADGAMGTMLQSANLDLSHFQGHDGCNELVNLTKPELVEEIHLKYFHSGSDAVQTNSFGCNFANFLEYGIVDRIYEVSFAAARIAKNAADQVGPGKFVLGSMGPGTKLPSLGHVNFSTLREHYLQNAKGLIDGGADGLLIETTQDLLQAKAAVVGAQDASIACGTDVPILVSITVEQSGTMLIGSEVPAAITSLMNLGINAIGMNCATGPEEMSEHLRTFKELVNIPISCMPNAGLPILRDGQAHYPLAPNPFAIFMERFIKDYGIRIIGGCCGTTPEHIAEISKLKQKAELEQRTTILDSVSSLYQSVNLSQDKTYLNIGERANANGSKEFRKALLDDNFDDCVEIAKRQVQDGSHVLDLCVDYVGRDGIKDMREIASRLATASTLPVMLDSTEPEVIRTGLEVLGGRSIINSLNYEDGDGPESRFQKMLNLAKLHGTAVVALTIDEDGQARTSDWKVRVATRLIEDLRREGIEDSSILIDALTFPIATGQEETRRDGLETLHAISSIKKKFPKVKTILGLSNISFGLNPAARQALNSIFLSEARKHGLDAAIVDSAKILPLNRIDERNQKLLLDLIYDKREYDQTGVLIYDPLSEVLNAFSDAKSIGSSLSREATLKDQPIDKRIQTRIIEGISKGLIDDLDEMVKTLPPLDIVNSLLLPAMKEVGDLFGAGVMQLPFVLQSAETMKLAVGHLEPLMDRVDDKGKGRVLLATVKGDVHDIGKNLVDIILTNNGYTVFNIGIKQSIQQIIDAAIENEVDVIGLSGLLVKSTVIMKENLEELNIRGLATKFPVILGGAALTRSYVEDDLASLYQGTVRYAKDAFEGLDLVEKLITKSRFGIDNLPPLRRRTHAKVKNESEFVSTIRSNISDQNLVPQMPFFGSKVIKGISLSEVAKWLDLRATFVGQWGLKESKNGQNSSLIETEGYPRLRYWLDEIHQKGLNEMAVVYGHYPAYSIGNKIYLLDEKLENEICEFSFPRQSYGEKLCLADYVRTKESGEPDFVSFHVVTMGNAVSKYANELFQNDRYRDYLEIHGLSVQLTEALAEMWHARVRRELGIANNDAVSLDRILKQEYQGERFSFGYPACPDLSMQLPLVDLLGIERIGVTLSEEFQLHPEQSTSAIIFHHPDARYFNAR